MAASQIARSLRQQRPEVAASQTGSYSLQPRPEVAAKVDDPPAQAKGATELWLCGHAPEVAVTVAAG